MNVSQLLMSILGLSLFIVVIGGWWRIFSKKARKSWKKNREAKPEIVSRIDTGFLENFKFKSGE